MQESAQVDGETTSTKQSNYSKLLLNEAFGEWEEEAAIELPSWLNTPRHWDQLTRAEQMLYIQRNGEVRRRSAIIETKGMMEAIRLNRLMTKSLDIWQVEYDALEFKCNQSELSLMTLQDEMLTAQSSLADLQCNQKKLYVFCRLKGEAELRAKTDLRKKEELARRRDKEHASAQSWRALCKMRQMERKRLTKTISFNCEWVDTASLSGFQQHFKTEVMR